MTFAKIISLHCELIHDFYLSTVIKKEFNNAEIMEIYFEENNNKIIVYCDNDIYNNMAFYYNDKYACYISKKHIIRDTGHAKFYSFIQLL